MQAWIFATLNSEGVAASIFHEEFEADEAHDTYKLSDHADPEVDVHGIHLTHVPDPITVYIKTQKHGEELRAFRRQEAYADFVFSRLIAEAEAQGFDWEAVFSPLGYGDSLAALDTDERMMALVEALNVPFLTSTDAYVDQDRCPVCFTDNIQTTVSRHESLIHWCQECQMTISCPT